MISILRSLTHSLNSIASCSSRRPLIRRNSTTATVVPRRDWRTAGHPAPRSVLDDDTTPVDLSEDNEAVNGARPNTPPLHRRAPPSQSTPHQYASHRRVMKKAFPDGWAPPRKLSREAMDGLRRLHFFDKETFTTPMLAEKFRISPEAVRRILKSKWEPSREQRAKFAERERMRRGAFIRLSRMEEKMRARELEDDAAKELSAPRSHTVRVTGFDAKDKLTFQ